MLNGIKTYVFDLDGTLIESHRTIYNSMITAFDKLGIKYRLSMEEFNDNIGLHFEDIFDNYDIHVPDFEEFLTIYKKLYFRFIDDSIPYLKVEDTLKKLREKGKKTALLTTKGQDQAELIIQHFGYPQYFDLIMGRRPGIAHKPDPQPLQIICSELETLPTECMMVGDTEMDIRCGKNAGTATGAATYGYRSLSFLQKEMPDYYFANLFDLTEL